MIEGVVYPGKAKDVASRSDVSLGRIGMFSQRTGWVIGLGFALCWSSAVMAQQSLTAEQIVNSLQDKASAPTSPLSADEILHRIDNLIVAPMGLSSYGDEQATGRAEIAPLVAAWPNVNIEIYFNYNSAVINQQSVPSLLALGQALIDQRLRNHRFIVAGHTDGVGSRAYNLKLSQERAEAVRHFLIQRFPLSPEALTAFGFGKEQLRDPANPDAAINRRVQVINMGPSGT
jgi:outer membrane protein OmpA-like peptidoglycan-associated protein